MNSKLQSEIVSSYGGLRNFRGKKFKYDYIITKDKESYSNLWEALDDFKRYEKVLSLDKRLRNLKKKIRNLKNNLSF